MISFPAHQQQRPGSLPPFNLSSSLLRRERSQQRKEKRGRPQDLPSCFESDCDREKTTVDMDGDDRRLEDAHTRSPISRLQRCSQSLPSPSRDEDETPSGSAKRLKRDIKVPVNFPFKLHPSVTRRTVAGDDSTSTTSSACCVSGDATPASAEHKDNADNVLTTMSPSSSSLNPRPAVTATRHHPDIKQQNKGKTKPDIAHRPEANYYHRTLSEFSRDEDHPISFRTPNSVSSILEAAMEESERALDKIKRQRCWKW